MTAAGWQPIDVAHPSPEQLAAHMVARAITQACRPDVLRIMEVTGLPQVEVVALVEQMHAMVDSGWAARVERAQRIHALHERIEAARRELAAEEGAQRLSTGEVLCPECGMAVRSKGMGPHRRSHRHLAAVRRAAL